MTPSLRLERRTRAESMLLRGLFVAFYAWLALGAFCVVKIVARALA